MSQVHFTARTHELPRPSALTLVRRGLLCLVAFLVAASAWGQQGGGKTPPGPNFLDEDQQYEIVSSGTGWRTMRAVDPNLRAVPDATLVAVWPDGVDTAPLPDSIKAELREDFGLTGGKAVSGNRSKNTDVIVVDKALVEAMANGDPLDPWTDYTDTDSILKLGCNDWKTKTKSYDWSFDEWSGSQSFNLPGGLTGTVGLNIPFRGHANLDFTYSYKRNIICIPYKFRFDQARFHGNVDVLGSTDLTASFSIAGQWDNETRVANPRLGSSTFWIGPIPVYLEYRLPLYIGYDISAELAGSVSVDTSFGVSGTFDYTCTRDTCTGSSDFDSGPDTDEVTGSIELDVRAQLNARLMFRVELYDDDFLYAEAGVKGLLEGHLWGYYGNNCGDGDGNGQNETVEALIAEADAGYDWTYGYGGILGTRTWSSTGPRWHLGYWDLLGEDGSSALSAMIHGPSEVLVGQPASYQISLRPCYPFSEPAWFGMAPGDWDGELAFIKKGETKTVSKVFTSAGSVDLRARVNHDQKGRQISINQWRTIQVGLDEPDAALVLSYIPAAGGSRRTFRSDAPGQPPTQNFLYDESQGKFHDRPGGSCENGSNNPTYLMVAYDGPEIRRCSYERNVDPSVTECAPSLVDQFNAGEFFVLNTDTYYTSPLTCELQDPPFPVCAPGDYCWGRVEFELLDGTTFTRMVAYRKYF